MQPGAVVPAFDVLKDGSARQLATWTGFPGADIREGRLATAGQTRPVGTNAVARAWTWVVASPTASGGGADAAAYPRHLYSVRAGSRFRFRRPPRTALWSGCPESFRLYPVGWLA